MRTKKRAQAAAPSGPAKLIGHATMGVAMGLAFTLMLLLIDPSGIATLIAHGGRQAAAVFVGTLVLTFTIGATLTGAVFILMEDH